MHASLTQLLAEQQESDLDACQNALIQARENCRLIDFPCETDALLTKEDLLRFFERLLEIKREEIQSRKLSPTVFYTWFDAQAGQLRFSFAIGREFHQLPFRATLNLNVSLEHVLSNSLKSNHLHGIDFFVSRRKRLFFPGGGPPARRQR